MTFKARAHILAVTAITLALLLQLPAYAGCPKTTLADIEDEVMCPVCGTPLALSKSPQAERQRAFIKSQIKACKSKAQVKEALAAEFGPDVLTLTDRKGFDPMAWLVPALVLILGGVAVAIAITRRRRSDGPPTGPPLTTAEEARLNDELERS